MARPTEENPHRQKVSDPVEVDRLDIPRGWYDLVILGRGWEAIGAAWYAHRFGVRVAILPGDAQTESTWLTVPRPLCQWWKQAGWPRGSAGMRPCLCWQTPEPPFVEGLPMGGLEEQVLPIDKALGQLAANGVAVFRGPVCFQAPDVLEVQGHPIPFRKVLLALGEQEEKPCIPGINAAELTTPEQLLKQIGFSLPRGSSHETAPLSAAQRWNGSSFDFFPPPGPQQRPSEGESQGASLRVAIVGDGPEECFWAQWLARQGFQVHLVLADAHILPNEDPEIRQWLQSLLIQDGVRIHSHALCRDMQPSGQAKLLLLERFGQSEKLMVDFLLVVPPRQPRGAGLQFELAGLTWQASGIPIDGACRTANGKIFAAGSGCGSAFRCPRIAWSMVQWAVAKSLGLRPPKQDWQVRFRCIPTDPPVFWVGMTPAEAADQFWQLRHYRVETASQEGGLLQNRPSRYPEPPKLLPPGPTPKRPEGFLRLHVRHRTARIVGGVFAGPWAHELADLVAFLMQEKIPLAKWTVPTGCASPPMQSLAEAARLARQDRRSHFWDLPLENCQRLWQKWKSRLRRTSESPNLSEFPS